MTDPYRCPTPCDEDCELNGWGCHEAHDVPSHREHDPEACKALALAGNLHALLDTGWLAGLGASCAPDGSPAGYYVYVRRTGDLVSVNFTGVSVAESAGKALEWAGREVTAP